MKKTIPFMISVLAIASIALTSVLGNTQTAYAGEDGCLVDPLEVGLILDPGASSQVITKTIDCREDIIDVLIDATDCTDLGIGVSFDNIFIDFDTGIWHADETITNDNDAEPGKGVICDVFFDIDAFSSDAGIEPQEINIETSEPKPEAVVGGDFLPIDSTALLLAGSQTFSWMIPLVLSGIGIGLFVVSRKAENS